MQTISDTESPARDREGLKAFFEQCRAAAVRRGHFQIASISLEVKHIAPLAVLQSIYDANELHFYVERVAADEAIAGADAVVEATFSGAGRFTEVRRFAAEVLENTIAIGDLEQPFAGPHFFTAFTFAESVDESASFAPATVFLPRWQVSCRDGRYAAVANVRIDPETQVDRVTDRVWSAYSKFNRFDYDPADLESAEGAQKVDPGDPDGASFKQAVATALDEIRAGDYEKIVLARKIDLDAAHPWQPLAALNRLRERYAGCFAFSFGGRMGRSFIGATPERILRVEGQRLYTEAIAGSAPRGQTAGEDARLAGALLESRKDLHEHACVRDSIERRLRNCGVAPEIQPAPGLLRLANVQHLRTSIEAALPRDVHILDLLEELHPTPAVGGMPRADAVSRIRALEQMDRGLYAGVVGWFNAHNEGEMLVAIRSALIDGQRATLYAGAGIVEGSTPEQEMGETELKLRALLDVLARA